MTYPALTPQELIAKLAPPTGRVSMVLDTDTYNEVDDQFALPYALLSKEKLSVEAVYAAPFHNNRSDGPADGMEKSYQEILRLLGAMNMPGEGLVYRGSPTYIQEGKPVDSPAARDLIERAMRRADDDPLYVVAIGAITNVASAILLEPAIVRKIVVVWLGGNPTNSPSAREFNLSQDIPAARVIFDSGVPVVLIPCRGVASHLLTTVPEINAHLQGKNALCDALCELFAAYSDDHYAWGKVIWDISAVAYLINPEWIPSALVHSPILTDQHTWSADPARHFIREASFVHRNPVFKDLFRKLTAL